MGAPGQNRQLWLPRKESRRPEGKPTAQAEKGVVLGSRPKGTSLSLESTAKDTSQGKAYTCNGHDGRRLGTALCRNCPVASNQPFLSRRNLFRGEQLWPKSALSPRHSRPKFRRRGWSLPL
jgi:hypothetical protein